MSANGKSKLTDDNILKGDLREIQAVEQDMEQEETTRNAFTSYIIEYHGGLYYHKAVSGSDCPNAVAASIPRRVKPISRRREF